jgi:hypothetical protein
MEGWVILLTLLTLDFLSAVFVYERSVLCCAVLCCAVEKRGGGVGGMVCALVVARGSG